MKHKLIPGGVYAISNNYSTHYYLLIEHDKHHKTLKLYVLNPSQSYTIDTLEDVINKDIFNRDALDVKHDIIIMNKKYFVNNYNGYIGHIKKKTLRKVKNYIKRSK